MAKMKADSNASGAGTFSFDGDSDGAVSEGKDKAEDRTEEDLYN